MPEYPRRTLLGGIGATITVALTGTGVAADGESVPDPADGTDFTSVLEFLPASVTGDELSLTLTDLDARREADEPHGPTGYAHAGEFRVEAESVETQAAVITHDDGYAQPITVLVGDIDLEAAADVEPESDSTRSVEYDRYDGDETVAVDLDGVDVVLIAAEIDAIEDAIAASEGETDRLVEADETLEEALDTYEDAHVYTVQFVDDHHLPAIDDGVVRYVVQTETVLDPDTIEQTLGIAFEDADDITDEFVEHLEADLAYTAATDEPTAEVDEDAALVTITVERDLEAEREIRDHDSPGSLRVDRDVDPDDDVLEIELGRGDPTPVDDLTLELDDEEYDRDIWADGHGKLEEGDTIVADMDDVEPNLSIRLRHDHDLGASSSGTTILNHFDFEFDYDVDAETVAVTYRDEFPLDGDRITLAAHEDYTYVRPDEDAPEPLAESQPWEGETLANGDDGTLDGISPGDRVLVGWDGTTHRDAIGQYLIQPPGAVTFEYEYDEETLSATLEFEDDAERPAEEYELRVDDEPAETQWTDEYETVSSGATVKFEDVPVGTTVEVVWNDDVDVSRTRALPAVTFEIDEDGTVDHVGGDALPAADLEAQVRTADEQYEIDVEDHVDGEFAEGDSFTVDVEGEIWNLQLSYDGQGVGHAIPR